MTVTTLTNVWAPASAEAPAGPYDLTGLANVHDELNIATSDTSQDARLSRFITESSLAISSYCNRVFAVEGLTDTLYVRASRTEPLPLSRFPIVNVATLNTSADTPSGAVLPLAGTIPSFVVANVPVSGLNIPPGTVVESVSGQNVTLSQPISADVPSGTPITFGFSLAQTVGGVTNGLILGTDYALDLLRGELIRLSFVTGDERSWERSIVAVACYAGYATVPADLEDAALRLVTQRFFAQGRDPYLKEQDQPGSLGRRVWWVGGPPKSGSLPDEIVGLLTPYRVPIAI